MKKIIFSIILLFFTFKNIFAAELEDLKKKSAAPEASTRRQVMETIGQGRIAEGKEILIRGLKDDNTQVKIAAIEALGILRLSETLPQLIELFQDTKASVRLSAVIAAGGIGDPSISPELIKLLDDKDNGVKNAAIRTLGKLKTKTAKEALFSVLSDGNEIMVKDTIWAFGEIGDSSVRAKLYEILDSTSSEPPDLIKEEIAKVLTIFKEEDSKPYLNKLFGGKTASIKIDAALGLAALKDNSVQKFAIKLLQDPDKMIRSQAVRILGELGNRKSIEALTLVGKNDPDQDIKNLAQDYLLKLK